MAAETLEDEVGAGPSTEIEKEAGTKLDGGADESEDHIQAKLHEELPPAVVAIVAINDGYCVTLCFKRSECRI